LFNKVENSNTVTADNIVAALATSGTNQVVSDDSQEETKLTTGQTDSATGINQLFNVNLKEIIRTIRIAIN
jgi:hypothetical protein